MKIFVVTNRERSADDTNLCFCFNVDSNKTLLAFSCLKFTDPLLNDIDKERINNPKMGYDTAVSILKGEYEFQWVHKPKINEQLLIQNKEIFGTDDLYQPLRVAFFNKSILGPGETSACEIYAFNKLNGHWSNATSAISTLEASNLFATSFVTKRHPRNIKTVRHQAYIGFPFPSSDVDTDESFLAVFPNENTKLIFNLPGEVQNVTYDYFYNDYLINSFITCKLEAVQKNDDGSTTLKATTIVDDKPVGNIPIVLSTDSGYISKTKTTTNDQGSVEFIFVPLGLDSGDVATISAGFRLYTGVSDVKITV